jgi:hypothetical protein
MTELIKNSKYEIKCMKADGDTVELQITIKGEKLSDEEMANLSTTIRKILYAFDRADSVSSRYGSADTKKSRD